MEETNLESPRSTTTTTRDSHPKRTQLNSKKQVICSRRRAPTAVTRPRGFHKRSEPTPKRCRPRRRRWRSRLILRTPNPGLGLLLLQVPDTFRTARAASSLASAGRTEGHRPKVIEPATATAAAADATTPLRRRRSQRRRRGRNRRRHCRPRQRWGHSGHPRVRRRCRRRGAGTHLRRGGRKSGVKRAKGLNGF